MCGRLPVGKGFLTVQLVGCGHVFGLLMRHSMAAGHNALRGSGPGQKLAFDDAMAHRGLSGSPDPPALHYVLFALPFVHRGARGRSAAIDAALVSLPLA